MNHRATAPASSLPTLVVPSSTATNHDAVPKPKVMRRPAQFSKPNTRSEPTWMDDTRIEAGTPLTPSPAPHAPVLRPWQDDARFACALLAIVIIVNLALSVWLAPKPAAPAAAPTQQAETVTPIAEPRPKTTTTAPESLIQHLSEAGALVSEQ